MVLEFQDPLFAFLLVAMGSPGPNIILLLASAARFGLVRTLPHLIGVVMGVGIIGAATGFGIGALMLAVHWLPLTGKIVAAVWIIWMAWGLYTEDSRSPDNGRQRPFTVVEAILFQWINPKIWTIALAASAGFSRSLPPTEEALRLMMAFSSVNLVVCCMWTIAGAGLGRILVKPSRRRMFNRIMAFFLALSAGMVFI